MRVSHIGTEGRAVPTARTPAGSRAGADQSESVAKTEPLARSAWFEAFIVLIVHFGQICVFDCHWERIVRFRAIGVELGYIACTLGFSLYFLALTPSLKP